MTDYISAAPRLTPRQAEVLALIAAGKTPKEIAKQLFVSPHTVKSTMDAVRQRLKAKSTAHAVALALRAGEIR